MSAATKAAVQFTADRSGYDIVERGNLEIKGKGSMQTFNVTPHEEIVTPA